MNKCCNCGSNNLMEIKDASCLPFHVYGDAKTELSKGSVFICLECGRLEFFNTYFVQKHKDKLIKNKKIQSDIQELTDRIEELKRKPFDPKPYEEDIEKLQKEIEMLKSLTNDRKEIQWRQEAIDENKRIIARRVDPNTTGAIHRLESKIIELEKEIEQ